MMWKKLGLLVLSRGGAEEKGMNSKMVAVFSICYMGSSWRNLLAVGPGVLLEQWAY
jgi:hypothetical protein